MNGNELRRLVNDATKKYTDQHQLPHYVSLNQTEPTVLFYPYQDAVRHGNFHNASYGAILGNPEWKRRLYKPHPRRNALPPERRAEALELDSCTSSDALLMNVFCYPGLFLYAPFVQLMGLPAIAEPDLAFGFKPGVPLRCSRSDATEIDLKFEDMLIEAKLTESGFTKKRSDIVERYRDFGSVFEPGSLHTLPELGVADDVGALQNGNPSNWGLWRLPWTIISASEKQPANPRPLISPWRRAVQQKDWRTYLQPGAQLLLSDFGQWHISNHE